MSLLIDGILQSDEQERIANETGVSAEEIQFERLIEKQDINLRRANVEFLTNTRKHGEKMKDVAKQIGVKNYTMTRWKTGEQEPSSAHLRELCRHFGLRSEVDPETDPIFLSPVPIGDVRRREWLAQQIKLLESSTLRDLFPALERLLRES